mmetsp:Transcript_16083/g.31503  ORF Transcript_16083/g.31503 Transcript_16083/m.31503 type:complete len:223 (+) Transcript_16083:30-698(+)
MLWRDFEIYDEAQRQADETGEPIDEVLMKLKSLREKEEGAAELEAWINGEKDKRQLAAREWQMLKTVLLVLHVSLFAVLVLDFILYVTNKTELRTQEGSGRAVDACLLYVVSVIVLWITTWVRSNFKQYRKVCNYLFVLQVPLMGSFFVLLFINWTFFWALGGFAQFFTMFVICLPLAFCCAMGTLALLFSTWEKQRSTPLDRQSPERAAEPPAPNEEETKV